jgi:hypothetical protein
LDTPIIAREYDKQSDGQPDPFFLYQASSDEKPPSDFVSITFENRKEILRLSGRQPSGVGQNWPTEYPGMDDRFVLKNSVLI